ncbi:MAG: SGNH/GDSL hydrolase family protein [Myxococcales bacterium]|nr:SGNH/GDSL hydrolase family protein [Myxococcales bacterium]
MIYRNDPATGPWAQPNQTAEHRSRCFVNQKISFNFHGMRDKHRSHSPSGQLRIALIGDSYLQGLQVQDHETVSQQLETLLNPSSQPPNAEVLNFGVSSTGTSVQLMRYLTMVRAFRPDIVILLFTVGNDITDNHPVLKGRRDPLVAKTSPYFLLTPSGHLEALITPGMAHQTSTLKIVLGRSLIARLAIQAFSTLRTRAARAQPHHMQTRPSTSETHEHQLYEEARTITKLVLQRFAREVNTNQAKFAVAVVPSGIYELPRGIIDRGTREVETMIRHTLRDRSVPVISLAEAFANEATSSSHEIDFAHTCDAHWNATAHRVAAQALAQKLRTLGWLNPSTSISTEVTHAQPTKPPSKLERP